MISVHRIMRRIVDVRIHPDNFEHHFIFKKEFQEWLDSLEGEYHFEITYNERRPLSISSEPALLSTVIASGDMNNMKYNDGRLIDTFFCSTEANELLMKLTWL